MTRTIKKTAFISQIIFSENPLKSLADAARRDKEWDRDGIEGMSRREVNAILKRFSDGLTSVSKELEVKGDRIWYRFMVGLSAIGKRHETHCPHCGKWSGDK